MKKGVGIVFLAFFLSLMLFPITVLATTELPDVITAAVTDEDASETADATNSLTDVPEEPLESETSEHSESDAALMAGTIVGSGQCGENLTWILDSKGILTISGTGNMYDYGPMNNTLQSQWYSQAESVYIQYGVTSIGEYAFYNCGRLTSVTIPNSVTSIGECAFYYCDWLTSVAIPNSVISIGNRAFSGCKSLTNVTLPNSVTSIGEHAFSTCSNLISVTIPNSVTSIGDGAFIECENLTNVTIPNSITSIGDEMFSECKSLTSVTIPSSITSIGNDAFFLCSNLASVTIPNSVTSIGEFAFCYCRALTSVDIPDSVTSIGRGAFIDCEKLTNVTIPNSITSIKSSMFYGCSGLTSMTIPDSVTSIGESAFSGCGALAGVTIPGSVIYIGSKAFFDCTSLKNVYYSGSEEDWTSIWIGNYNYTLIDADIHYNSHNPDSPSVPFKPKEISFWFGDNFTVGMGEELVVTAAIPALDGLSESDVTWTNGDESVFEIVETNTIQLSGIGELMSTVKITGLVRGSALLTVSTVDGRSAVCEVKVTESSYYLRICANKPSLTNNVGDKVELLCQLYKDDELVRNWNKAVFTAESNAVFSLEEQYSSSIGYIVNVRGISEGQSSLTITDADSGAFTVINLTFGINAVSPYSYLIYDVPQFSIYAEPLTNFYNINGLYVNSFQYGESSSGDGYNVQFDVYNKTYMHGAVDVYDANGHWIASKKISKYTDITSLIDTGKSLYYLIEDYANGNITSYMARSYSKKTPISVYVPKGGYFTISNNFADSPGTFLYNELDFVLLAANTIVSLAVDEVKMESFEKLMETKVFQLTDLDNILVKQFRSMALKTATKALEIGYGNAVGATTAEFEELLSSAGVGSLKDAVKTAFSLGETVFEAKMGPFGAILKTMFSFSKLGDSYVQALQVCNSINKPFVTIHTSPTAPIQGVTVTPTSNAVDSEAILQVFRIDNGEISSAIANDSDAYENHAIYNIRFLQDGKDAQITGKVTVRIPVPTGYQRDDCVVLRQEDSGDWTVMDVTFDGNYLVFETEHFSVYAVATINESGVALIDTSFQEQDSGPDSVVIRVYRNSSATVTACCAFYDSNGMMLDVLTETLTDRAADSHELDFSVNDENAAIAKIFIWDENHLPSCSGRMIKLK